MKSVIKGAELYNYLEENVKLISDTVKTTIGPRGSNVIVSTMNMPPFITNDGVTIADAIASSDGVSNTILTLIKEAALKTNEDAGDGTTTTIVLLESIFLNGLKEIKNGYNPLKLKQEIDESVKQVIDLLNKESMIASDKDLINLASISANDTEIGKLITEFYIKLNRSKNIKIMESDTLEDHTEKLLGYFIDSTLASPYFLKNKESITINNPNLLIIDKRINDLEDLAIYINDAINKDTSLLIMADSFSDQVINEILAINESDIPKIVLINNFEYGINKFAINDDLQALMGVNNNYGTLKKVKIDKNNITFIGNNSSILNRRINELKEEIKNETKEYELDLLKNRLSKLENNYGIIYVGGNTTLERRERKMRFDDAMSAIYSASDGILMGGGIPYLKISDELNITTSADKIIKKALYSPFKQILENNAINYTEIYKYIKDHNFNVVYNVKNNTFEEKNNTSVIDSKKVLVEALINASSIAGMLLTTTHLIINEEKKFTNSLNEFSEL